MERRDGLKVKIDKTTWVGDTKIEAYKANEFSSDPSDTALHEAKHVVAGKDDGAQVEEVSVVPGPGYLGITKFNRFTDAGAAAPHADGHSGTSWDISLIEMRGGSLASASARGKNSIIKNPKHVLRVAQELDRRGTLHGPEVNQIYKELEEGEEIRIDISGVNGLKSSYETRTNEPFVIVPNKELSLTPNSN